MRLRHLRRHEQGTRRIPDSISLSSTRESLTDVEFSIPLPEPAIFNIPKASQNVQIENGLVQSSNLLEDNNHKNLNNITNVSLRPTRSSVKKCANVVECAENLTLNKNSLALLERTKVNDKNKYISSTPLCMGKSIVFNCSFVSPIKRRNSDNDNEAPNLEKCSNSLSKKPALTTTKAKQNVNSLAKKLFMRKLSIQGVDNDIIKKNETNIANIIDNQKKEMEINGDDTNSTSGYNNNNKRNEIHGNLNNSLTTTKNIKESKQIFNENHHDSLNKENTSLWDSHGTTHTKVRQSKIGSMPVVRLKNTVNSHNKNSQETPAGKGSENLPNINEVADNIMSSTALLKQGDDITSQSKKTTHSETNHASHEVKNDVPVVKSTEQHNNVTRKSIFFEEFNKHPVVCSTPRRSALINQKRNGLQTHVDHDNFKLPTEIPKNVHAQSCKSVNAEENFSALIDHQKNNINENNTEFTVENRLEPDMYDAPDGIDNGLNNFSKDKMPIIKQTTSNCTREKINEKLYHTRNLIIKHDRKRKKKHLRRSIAKTIPFSSNINQATSKKSFRKLYSGSDMHEISTSSSNRSNRLEHLTEVVNLERKTNTIETHSTSFSNMNKNVISPVIVHEKNYMPRDSLNIIASTSNLNTLGKNVENHCIYEIVQMNEVGDNEAVICNNENILNENDKNEQVLQNNVIDSEENVFENGMNEIDNNELVKSKKSVSNKTIRSVNVRSNMKKGGTSKDIQLSNSQRSGDQPERSNINTSPIVTTSDKDASKTNLTNKKSKRNKGVKSNKNNISNPISETRSKRVRVKTVPYWLPQCRVQYGYTSNGCREIINVNAYESCSENDDIKKTSKKSQQKKQKQSRSNKNNKAPDVDLNVEKDDNITKDKKLQKTRKKTSKKISIEKQITDIPKTVSPLDEVLPLESAQPKHNPKQTKSKRTNKKQTNAQTDEVTDNQENYDVHETDNVQIALENLNGEKANDFQNIELTKESRPLLENDRCAIDNLQQQQSVVESFNEILLPQTSIDVKSRTSSNRKRSKISLTKGNTSSDIFISRTNLNNQPDNLLETTSTHLSTEIPITSTISVTKQFLNDKESELRNKQNQSRQKESAKVQIDANAVHVTNTNGLGLAFHLPGGKLLECFSRKNSSLEYVAANEHISKAVKLQVPNMKCLHVKIAPHGEKPMGTANKYNLLFSVMEGRVKVTIFAVERFCEQGDVFYVPLGVQYRIQNETDQEVLLLNIAMSNM